ncbi:diguanylate cyclase [Micromonospora sp. NBC_01699]|uniref:sensor domain-containing diguanylate cyclase n=1 Tax=Micromonospora sp. NBC_01699 TaxID=2975984 RepID=UPI002E34D92F|nr:diguanylate cyclase [Micromonospora sp. NBC_01699]
MPPELERVITAATARLPLASTALEACQLTVAALGRHATARISVLLPLHDRLRRVAATGSWQIFATVPLDTGAAGRVFTSGRARTTEAAPDGRPSPTSIADGALTQPDVVAQTCVPVISPTGAPIGVLTLDWTEKVDLAAWQATAERVAARLGARITQLGGPPVESRDEKLLRHAATLTAASDESDLVAAATNAARDVSGLDSAILLLCAPGGLRPADPGGDGGGRDDAQCRLRARLTGEDTHAALARLMERVHDCGSTYTLAQAGTTTGADEYDPPLPDGVGTLIAVPLGPADTGGLLLVADERVRRPDPTTVNLLELLAAQAWICLDRLRSLAGLRERAGSDPLTGLRHYGSFGERITATTPGRTALLAIDVDDFKIVNDTYGHQAGDQVLVELARALELALRQGDELYRVGGDEFIAVIEVGRPEEAAGIAERLVAAARRIGRTISVGVALQHDAESPELTLRRADAALYDAKREGRDGIRLSAA